MFDSTSAALLRSAPALPGLDPAQLPGTLTAHYARLVARRLRGVDGAEGLSTGEDRWPLTRIADTYELVAAVHDDRDSRRAAAFVAGSAHQILSQEWPGRAGQPGRRLLSRDRVDPALTASLLFLCAEQYADANDSAQLIRLDEQDLDVVTSLLSSAIRDLAAGKLGDILVRAARRLGPIELSEELEDDGTTLLYEALLAGIELFASEVLGDDISALSVRRFEASRLVFVRVADLSTSEYSAEDLEGRAVLTTYPGPRHLAGLLLSAHDATASAAVTKIRRPPDVGDSFWKKWLRHRAETAPFVWPNHRFAIDQEFYLFGKSAVMIFPTGAGKTTVSCLKIAATLALGKNVVFVAPTHALVEQLTTDLQEVFPESILESVVSSDFDRLFATGTNLNKIEIMTPERCLALLSYAPHAFNEVGLMVFDECHLLSPTSGLRRALDGMFCVLAFSDLVPDADFLFLSAMVRNGAEFAEWIEELTSRECVFVDPLWKPSRQARGVVIYRASDLASARENALSVQRKEDLRTRISAAGLRAAAKKQLSVRPFALFGLKDNWLSQSGTRFCITRLIETSVQLSGRLRHGRVVPTANVNQVAAQIALSASRSGLKVIIFVNVKHHAVSTAGFVAEHIGTSPLPTPDEAKRWAALNTELGGLEHSLLPGPASAVPHNAHMIRLERDLSERMFRRKNGASVIVATPTLAQGLNLPAHLAILASDMRANPDDGGRQALAAHEILNAAGRAGRAGYLANGLVLLIPESIIEIPSDRSLNKLVLSKLKSILPEDDRCITMTDPIQIVLDRISEDEQNDLDVEYAINRLLTTATRDTGGLSDAYEIPVQKSFAYFLAKKREYVAVFDDQVGVLTETISQRTTEATSELIIQLSAQSGASILSLVSLFWRLQEGSRPTNIDEWVQWTLSWLCEDEQSRRGLLGRESSTILRAVGREASSELTRSAIEELRPGVLAWLRGWPLCEIDAALGGDRSGKCRRARYLVTSVIPMSFAFVMGIVARVAHEVFEEDDLTAAEKIAIDCLPTAVRRGYDSPLKLAFSEVDADVLSRVQVHLNFREYVGQQVVVEDEDDYVSLVDRVRQHVPK